MIFLSAQPDTFYFLWQLQIQLFNFKSLGIKAEDIHVLIGYDPETGLSSDFKDLIDQNRQATFYVYADTRTKKDYLPSIRPHIIAKHFVEFPNLTTKVIFYHDSDILFKKPPEFHTLTQDEVWYSSDTSSYLNSNYIKSSGGHDLFHKMCEVLAIDPTTVEENDHNAGGGSIHNKELHTFLLEKAFRASRVMNQTEPPS